MWKVYNTYIKKNGERKHIYIVFFALHRFSIEFYLSISIFLNICVHFQIFVHCHFFQLYFHVKRSRFLVRHFAVFFIFDVILFSFEFLLSLDCLPIHSTYRRKTNIKSNEKIVYGVLEHYQDFFQWRFVDARRASFANWFLNIYVSITWLNGGIKRFGLA